MTTNDTFQMPRSRTKSGGKRRRINDFFKKGRYKSYINVTGPGQYEVPQLWGKRDQKALSIKSGPFYTIGARCKTPILSKGHTQDLKGKGM